MSYTVLSAFVKGERPVNLIIIANPEEGKTMMLEKFSAVKSCLFITDFTRFGILHEYLHLMRTGEIRTIIVPDLAVLLEGKSSKLASSTLLFLNSITEEGIPKIATFYTPLSLDKPLKCGFISAITPGLFFDKRSRFHKIGFTSRVLPVSYTLEKEVTAEIMSYVFRREHMKESPVNISLPKEDVEVRMDEKLSRQLYPITSRIGEKVGTHGFRIQRQCQVLCMARAISNGRSEVSQEDVDEISSLMFWINLDFHPLGNEHN